MVSMINYAFKRSPGHFGYHLTDVSMQISPMTMNWTNVSDQTSLAGLTDVERDTPGLQSHMCDTNWKKDSGSTWNKRRL